MAKKSGFKLNKAGVRALLRSEEMKSVLGEYASAMVGRAGEGYEQDVYVGKNRANATVWPDSPNARRDNLKNNTALKAVK